MSAFVEINRMQFHLFPLGDYQRSYGDWRDDKDDKKRALQDLPANSYPTQSKENEYIFTFSKTNAALPRLALWEAPEAKDIRDQVISCACGILAPPTMKGRFGEHFMASGEHAQCFGEDHERNIWECMYDAVINGQAGMRRHAMGEDAFLQGSCSQFDCTTPAAEAAEGGLQHPADGHPICSACLMKLDLDPICKEVGAKATASPTQPGPKLQRV